MFIWERKIKGNEPRKGQEEEEQIVKSNSAGKVEYKNFFKNLLQNLNVNVAIYMYMYNLVVRVSTLSYSLISE